MLHSYSMVRDHSRIHDLPKVLVLRQGFYGFGIAGFRSKFERVAIAQVDGSGGKQSRNDIVY